MNESIELKVRQGVATHLNKEENEVSGQSRIVEDLGADSLDVLELLMSFEQEFKCANPEEDARKISTVRDLVNYISSLEKSNMQELCLL